MARNLKRTQNIDYTQKFNNLDSIYDENGALRTDIGDNINWNNIINTATSQGLGSVNIGDKEYTLYKKKDGNIVKPWEQEGWDKDNVDVNDASSVAIYNYYHPNNKQTFQGSSVINPSNIQIDQEELIDKGNIPDTPKLTPFNERYNLSNDQLGNIQSMPDSGRKSNFRQTLGLYEDQDKYFSNPEVIRNMNHYYGEGKWNGNYYHIGNRSIDPRESMKSTLGYIYGNSALTKDRMGKTQDYLAMESQRLDRTLGGYDNITYRDMLNYFSKEGNNQYIHGKYYNNKDKFLQELYELGASRNGMQRHELQRLFGNDYDKILHNISPNSMKQGGIIKMLFI